MSEREPKPGERWTLKVVTDPWGGSPSITVEILDVKDGWVRYSMGGSMSDLRMKMSDFVGCYEAAE